MTYPTLSKSQYIKGLQCPKALWLNQNRRDLKPEISPATQALFDRGNEVGELAHKRFPDVVHITNPHYEITQAADATKSYVMQGKQNICEATAINDIDGTHARIDILQQVSKKPEWDLIEVKSSTKVKDYHYDDMAFQYHVFTGAGYTIRKCYMMVIDNTYVRNGAIDPDKLFRLEDITEQVLAKQDSVKAKIKELLAIKGIDLDPTVPIGSQCGAPFECDYKSHCWKNVPDYSVFKAFPMDEAEAIMKQYNTTDIRELPDDVRPSGIKLVELNAHLANQEHAQSKDISNFLSQLQYPLYFLDFETIMPAVPLYNSSRPYQQIPFQFSLHRQDEKGGELHHMEYLHKEKSDPRLDFIKNLISACGDNGSVVVYNATFEKGRNNDLAECFPEYGEDLQNINDRMIDLLVPFKNRWLYSPEQLGSASLKKVLPAFTDENYAEQKIGSGGEAMFQYESFVKSDKDPADCEKLFQDLIAYCSLDTLAMVKLLEVLNKQK